MGKETKNYDKYMTRQVITYFRILSSQGSGHVWIKRKRIAIESIEPTILCHGICERAYNSHNEISLFLISRARERLGLVM